MVSVHSTYTDSHTHGHHHAKKRKKSVVRNDPDLLTRTSWVDASVAYAQILKGKATGNKRALWLRSCIQNELYNLGYWIQKNAGKFLFVGILILTLFAVGLKSAILETQVDKLWVEEGGRLQKELEYVESTLGVGAGATNELIIQTPRESESGSILTTDALLTHLEVIKAASRVVVEKEDVTWQLKDLCYAPTIPLTEIQLIDQILDKLFPCAIVTPLDCFWEGSKLLGPDHPVHIPLGDGEGSMLLSWQTLNPMNLVQQMKSFNFDFDSFEDFMKTAGINSGYQEKPCLDPHDPDCPPTAPNKESRQKPDIGAELTGGCYGFATRYMHWPEQLVVGGTIKNKTGHIVRAKGLQSSIQLMGEKDLYDYWSDTFKVHSLEWNRESAAAILSEWQTKFSQEVASLVTEKQMHRKYEINAFSSSYLNDTLAQFSEVKFSYFLAGVLLMLIYVSVALYKRQDSVKSQVGLGLSAVILVVLSMAGGLGCGALLGIHFNACITQTIPLLALGFGVNSMFLMMPTYAGVCGNSEISNEDKVGEVLKRSGVWVLMKDICITAAFLAGAIMPIPAFRAFGFHAAIVFAFNSASMLLLFPALLGLDLRRITADSLDVLCCYQKSRPSSEAKEDSENNWTLTAFVKNYWSHWILKTPAKITVLILASVLTCGGLYGLVHLKQGLGMQEVIPSNTSAYEFIRAQDAYFGFYHMYAVTQGHFEYPQGQKTLYDYHRAFVRIPNIIKDDDGGLPEFWLPLFRNWLLRIQNAFDDDFSEGNIYETGWHMNASADGILGYKLLVQTGHVDYPVDETLLLRNRLVDSHGMINPSAFYNYLSAWYSNDAMAYAHSQCNIVPSPKAWHHDARDGDLRVPKSQPIVYAQIPFYLYNLPNTDGESMVEMIKQVRQVCAKFEEQRGLPNFPTGVPFTFWEQYINLRMWLLLAIGVVLAAVFISTSFLTMSFWIGSIVLLVIASLLIQLFGLMQFLGVHLSAVPAVITLLAIGLGVEFSLHIIIGFVTTIGNKNRRIMISLQHMLVPVFHGAVSTFLGIIMLAFSHFDFVVRYFFLVLTGLIVLGVFNGLIFLPVLLVLVGPPGEVIPNDNGDAIDPPTPNVETIRRGSRSNPLHKSPPNNIKITNLHHHHSKKHHHQSDLSLSTIAEESGSYASSAAVQEPNNAYPLTSQSFNGASVFVEPHVVVETTTYPSTSHGNNSVGSSRCSTPTTNTQQVTKVTATAKFKVEVHTPSSNAVEQQQRPVSSRSHRRSSNNRESLSASSSVQSSLSDSLRSSLSSNDGDAGFSEK